MSKHSFRWGVDLYDDAHTQIPNDILRYYHLVPWQIKNERGEVIKTGVGISNTEMMFIIHLASHKHETENSKANPSLTTTLRERMNYKSNLGIIKIKQNLTEKGLLLSEGRPGKTSVYDFSPLSTAVMEIAYEKRRQVECRESLTKVNGGLNKS